MEPFFLSLHLIVVLALTGAILLQNQETDGFAGSSPVSFMRTRGTANTLTRLTAILAACFFATSLGLSFYARHYLEDASNILDRIEEIQVKPNPAKPDLPSSDLPSLAPGKNAPKEEKTRIP